MYKRQDCHSNEGWLASVGLDFKQLLVGNSGSFGRSYHHGAATGGMEIENINRLTNGSPAGLSYCIRNIVKLSIKEKLDPVLTGDSKEGRATSCLLYTSRCV